MTRAIILGGGGFLGRKLAHALAEKGSLAGEPLSRITAADLAAPEDLPAGVEPLALDVTDRAATATALAEEDVVFHLAAVVSGQAEAEFDLGMRVNLDGTVNVLEAARHGGRTPRVVFTSSVAVYGGDVPSPIVDWTALEPQTSYGAQKAAGELLLSDYSRKGFLDGVGLRLPTISIRPGKPNAAASSFMSSIFREPLQGETANCPVGPDYPVWHSSPRTVIRNIVHAAEVDAAALGRFRAFALPGRTDTIGEMIAAMTRVAGPAAEGRITWNRDPEIERIVTGWRGDLAPTKAPRLGFVADASFEDNVRYFLEDDIRK
ncbi:MAG: D-erythronate dehydrogenase [Paracoccaceae bacterium]